MTLKKSLNKIISLITPDNMEKSLIVFNKGLQDFGKSMDSITKELSSDISKSNDNTAKREARNKANLEKIWGKKK
jgi:hypothetical protein